MKIIVCSILLATLAFQANGHSGLSLSNENCPWTATDVSWRKFFIEEREIENAAILRIFNTENIPNKETWKGFCYWTTYYPNKRSWRSQGYHSDRKEPINSDIYSSGKVKSFFHEGGFEKRVYWDRPIKFGPADRYKLSIRNETFTYNEAGEVFHKEYGLVGQLLCHVPPSSDPCQRK